MLHRRALWDHPERKQTILQRPIFSLQSTHGKLPRTTVQNLTSRICKLEKLFADKIATYTSITAAIPSQDFFMIKFTSLNLVVPMLSFGSFPLLSLYLTLQKWRDHHLISPLHHPQVLVALFSELIPMDTTSSSNFTLMVLEPLLARVHQFQSPCSLVTTTFSFNDPTEAHSLRNPWSTVPMNTWTKTIQLDQNPVYKKPTISQQKLEFRQSSIIIINFNPHCKFFSETEGFLFDGASYIEIKFSDPPVLNSHTQISLRFPFP